MKFYKTNFFAFSLAVCLIIFLSISCVVEPTETDLLEMTGTVDGVDIYSNAYLITCVLFNTSVEELILTEIDKVIMQSWGLDPKNSADVSRFYYFTKQYDFRMIISNRSEDKNVKNKDFSVYLFNLEKHLVQPGTKIQVIDASIIGQFHENKDLKELGRNIRLLIDKIRSNGMPDALVVFAPDRSDEDYGQSLLVNLFAKSARFAGSGTVEYFNIKDNRGETIRKLAYPFRNINKLSLRLNAIFQPGENVNVFAPDIKIKISG